MQSNSRLIGKPLAEAALGPTYGAPVLQVEGRELTPELVLGQDDVLVVRVPDGNIDRLMHELGLSLQPLGDAGDELLSRQIGLAEVMPTPRSEHLGMRLVLGAKAKRWEVQFLAVRRRGKALSDREVTLEFGDSLLVRGTWEAIAEMQGEWRNFVVLGAPAAMADELSGLRPRAGVAVAALAGMVAMMVAGVVPTVIAALIAAAAMVLGGCLSTRDAYRAISWSSVVLIAAMIPMGKALEATGGARLLAEALVSTLGDLSPVALMAGVFLLTTGFSQVINNTRQPRSWLRPSSFRPPSISASRPIRY